MKELKIKINKSVLSIENYYNDGYELKLGINYAINLPYMYDVDIFLEEHLVTFY